MVNSLSDVKLISKDASENWLSQFFASWDKYGERDIMKPSKWHRVIEKLGAYLSQSE